MPPCGSSWSLPTGSCGPVMPHMVIARTAEGDIGVLPHHAPCSRSWSPGSWRSPLTTARPGSRRSTPASSPSPATASRSSPSTPRWPTTSTSSRPATTSSVPTQAGENADDANAEAPAPARGPGRGPDPGRREGLLTRPCLCGSGSSTCRLCLLLLLGYGLLLLVRRRWIARVRWHLRPQPTAPGAARPSGAVGFSAWAATPATTWSSSGSSGSPRADAGPRARAIGIEGRRAAGPRAHALYAGHLVVSCRLGQEHVELAMAPDALTGFRAWLEAAPPGRPPAESDPGSAAGDPKSRASPVRLLRHPARGGLAVEEERVMDKPQSWQALARVRHAWGRGPADGRGARRAGRAATGAEALVVLRRRRRGSPPVGRGAGGHDGARRCARAGAEPQRPEPAGARRSPGRAAACARLAGARRVPGAGLA